MRIHYLQHVPFEDLANIEGWAEKRGHAVTVTRLFSDDVLPEPETFDWLIVMGGPMNIYEEGEYPWLKREKQFIKRTISMEGKVVLGICLGAQLIADILGGKVFRNDHKEIGWFPVSLTNEGKKSAFFSHLPEEFTAFHWHGDTFEIPKGCMRTVKSEGCKNQAFEYDNRVIGLQFHLESSNDSIQRLIAHCGGDLAAGKYVQTAEEMMRQIKNANKIELLLTKLLDSMERAFASRKELVA